jgi:hypothetical protein
MLGRIQCHVKACGCSRRPPPAVYEGLTKAEEEELPPQLLERARFSSSFLNLRIILGPSAM